ncbi:MAG TPA: hypothetical protein VGO80_18645 [Solirubrobacteraceae bacterium]|jgi:hypothetical protein|nr:hypothetical protein [Solirubrobacteraceae bacterium]
MRPLALAERIESQPSVSLTELLSGRRDAIGGTTAVRLEGYVAAERRCSTPPMRCVAALSQPPYKIRTDGRQTDYVSAAVDHEPLAEGPVL